MELTLEQQFNIRFMEERVKTLRNEDLQSLFIAMYKQNLIKENTYKSMLKQHWGISNE